MVNATRQRQIAVLTITVLLCIFVLNMRSSSPLTNAVDSLVQAGQQQETRPSVSDGKPTVAAKAPEELMNMTLNDALLAYPFDGEGELPEVLKASDAMPVPVLDSCGSIGKAPRAHGRQQASSSRLFDVFLFNDEFIAAEIRLMTLGNVVDYFVVVESNMTLSGSTKPYHFDEMEAHLDEAFRAKIIRVRVPMDMTFGKPSNRNFRYEMYLRENVMIQIGAVQLGGAKEGDLVIVADLDEIPKPEILLALKRDTCEMSFPVVLTSRLFYYSYRVLHNARWGSPQVDRVTAPPYTHNAMDIRSHMFQPDEIADGAWHCSWCFRSITSFLKKMQSYSHTEHNREPYNHPESIAEHVRDGRDLFERSEVLHNSVQTAANPRDYPPYLASDPDRFGHFLDHTKKPFVYMLEQWRARHA